ncbi:protein NUCLEAR FUSION DEFECTIVE 4-like [Cicer arietinum]|uniref:Protein NUCLEAR FUSION DEFECTIVE 4-like n=1 Tax=Cicer arietinum TaxID=3827 RepID=A0A1S2Y6Y1_CICAR|nr:protein NUCLEAR FUSION DEFECTIVE 4-like [Cicer arietinum]
MHSTSLKWLSLVAIIWLQAINGTNTDFPAYSSQLKQLLSISQIQLNTLAFASDAGKLFGWLSGLAAIHLPLWLVLIIGSTLGLIGYGVQYYLFLTNQISSLSYWHVFLLTFLAGNSICWINTVCYVVAIRNFLSNSQVAVGLSTSYQGLSAKIYINIVDVVSPHNKAKTFLFMNSLVPIVISLLVAPIVREIEVKNPKHSSVGFALMFVITIATGIYAVMSSLQFFTSKISSLGVLIGLLVSLLLPLLLPISFKIKELVDSWYKKRERLRVYHFTMDENNNEESRVSEVKEGEDCSEVEEIDVMEEIGVKLMLKRMNFWLYLFVYFFGATIGLVFLNNLGQIAESRGCSATSSLVSLSSSFGFFGRLMPSLVNYFYRGKHKISRAASMVAVMAPTSCAFFLLINKNDLALYISTAVIGVSTGAITSIAVSTTTELFGTKNFSVNHNVLVANIPIGSFLFGYSAALVYRKEGNEHGNCIGIDCYRNTFILWGSCCCLGTLLALILHTRTRNFYSHKQ